MLSWKTTRIICTVLLLLPVVHLAYLLSREALATLDPSPDVWAKELSAYARADREGRLPKHPIVVVGGRRVKLWRDLDELLDEPVLMRGLGDAIVEDITYNYSALVGYYQPSAVVVLPGNSEFHIRDRKSAEQLVAAIKNLEAVDASHSKVGHFYVFTPIKTPIYPRDYAEIERAGELLAEWAQRHDRVRVIDANPLLTDGEGKPRPRYFLNDGINLNELGYLRLTLLLQSAREADTASAMSTTEGS
jgi:hypothetical protein